MSLRTSCSLNPLLLHTATFFVTQFIKTPTALLQEWSLQPTGLRTTGETLYVDRQWAVWMRLPRLSRRGLRTHTLLTDPGSNDFGRHLFCDAFVNSVSCMLKAPFHVQYIMTNVVFWISFETCRFNSVLIPSQTRIRFWESDSENESNIQNKSTSS